MAGRAVVGIHHEESNKVCQDYIIYRRYKDVKVMVLADGASTCKHAAFGAEKACYFIVNYFKKNSLKAFKSMSIDELKLHLITRLRSSLKYHAKQKKTETSQLSSTLLFVVISNDEYIIGHIGDGVIGLFKNGNVQVLSKPENAEFANVTYFTSSQNLKQHLRVKKGVINQKSIAGFVMMSDGAAKSLYNPQELSFSIGVTKLFDWMSLNNKQKMNTLIYQNLKEVIRLKTTDDCSLGLVYKSI